MDFTSVIKTVAPWIGTALGGPLGGLAVEAATSALGLSDKTADGLKEAFQKATMTAADALALQKADQDFQVTMQTLGYKQLTDLEAIAAGDRKDARAMQIAVRSNVPAMLTLVVTLGFFGILTGLMAGWLHAADSQALLLMLGSLTTAWISIVAFWVGTTHDSGVKTDYIARSPAIPK